MKNKYQITEADIQAIRELKEKEHRINAEKISQRLGIQISTVRQLCCQINKENLENITSKKQLVETDFNLGVPKSEIASKHKISYAYVNYLLRTSSKEQAKQSEFWDYSIAGEAF